MLNNLEKKEAVPEARPTLEDSPLFQQAKDADTGKPLSEYDSPLTLGTGLNIQELNAPTENKHGGLERKIRGELEKKYPQEAAAEAAKETVAKFGTVDKVIETEQVSFEKSGAGDCSRQISFGSLASGEFKKNANYLRWKDGIGVGEVNKGWIEELTNEIAAIFGNDHIKASKQYFMNNAGINTYLGRLVYDPSYLRKAGNEYGMDSILGTLAHEVGHRVVYNIGLESEITPYENEACADYIAGLTARLCKLNSTHRLAWYNGRSEVSLDGIHPGKSVRLEAFTRGLTRIDTGKEATKLKVFEAFSPYDLEGVYQDADLLKSILYQDVITPLRNGEIKKV